MNTAGHVQSLVGLHSAGTVSSWEYVALGITLPHTVGSFLKGKRHRSSSTCLCYWLYWWAVQFTFSQGAKTATAFMSPVLPHLAEYKLLNFHFSTTYLLPSFSPILYHWLTHSPPCPAKFIAAVWSLHFLVSRISFLLIPIMVPAWCECCCLAIP